MPTSAPFPAAGPMPAERTAWRTPLLVSAVVAAAHLALLGAIPLGNTSDAPTPAERFITRTIVIAPPPVAEAPKPVPAPVPAPPPAAPRPKPAKPRPAPAAAPVPQAIKAEPEPGPEAPAAPAAPGNSAAPASDTSSAAASAAPEPPPPPPPPPAEVPPPLAIPGAVRLKFAVTGQQGVAPLSGVFGELSWQQDGQAYEARLSLSFLFKTLRTQQSTGRIGPAGIAPDRFSDTRKTEVASHFVRDQGQIVFSNNAPSVPLMPGAQDRLSVILQLGALLAGDPARYPTDGAIAVQTAGPRDADIWIFKIGEEEYLRLPGGDFIARKLTRNPRYPYDDKVELWLAPALGFLPVRILLTQPNGDFADMRLRERLAPAAAN
ncbi:DUF3108 domain-containing protein [Variovorax sp. LT1R16]|uniref:DUF3108 domain-containing protein n=1 Tax=Variovorax sp. LT1R16 TaxID=3443728 RepID=UPI003F470D70